MTGSWSFMTSLPKKLLISKIAADRSQYQWLGLGSLRFLSGEEMNLKSKVIVLETQAHLSTYTCISA
jgi:hypothetical protein